MSQLAPEVVAELAQYRSTLDALHAGAVDPDKEFRPYRLVHGVYGQRQGGTNQMVRIKLKYGKITPDQMRVVAAQAERHANGISHITTRQAIQFHYVQLDDTPALLQALEECGLTTREACGNAVRNVVASPFIGTRVDEPFAVEPYAEAVFRHFLRGVRSASLPRKFKIGLAGSTRDTGGQIHIQDIGIMAVVEAGPGGESKQGFRVVAGGGLGSMPVPPMVLHTFLPKAELIPCCEALVRVHHVHGNRENRAKARLKFVLKQHGEDGFRKLYDEQRAIVAAEGIRGAELPDALPAPAPSALPGGDAAFTAWVRANVQAHREPGLATVSVCVPRGDLDGTQLRALADLAEQFAGGDVRTTNDQNLVFRRVPISRLAALYPHLAALGFAGHAHSLVDVVSCPGASTCQLGITLSKNLASELERSLAAIGADARTLQGRINISGCPNSCGQHHIAAIGFHGAAAKIGSEMIPHYVLLVGGEDAGTRVHHGTMICRIPARKVAAVTAALAGWYQQERQGDEGLAAWLRRISGEGLDKAQATAAKAALKARIEPIAAIPIDRLTADDLHDLGVSEKFEVKLGTGECMA
jgi:sulfite reductase beta subunit-like hemoprotein